MAHSDPEAVPDGFVRLVAAGPTSAEPRRVAALLAADPPWPALTPVPSETVGLRRYALDLRLRLGGDSAALATFSKAAYLDLGQPHATDAGWEVDIGWRASTAAPLFPVFAGRLFIVPGEMRVDGLYAPPGGALGRVADRMLLHVAAGGTARWLLGEIDRQAMAAD